MASEGTGTGRALLRAMLRRCPRCGAGKLFSRWVRLVPECPRCGLRFEREEGASFGSWAINLGLTELAFGALVLVYIAASWPDVNWGWLFVWGLVVTALVPFLFYPFSKTIWAAIDYLLHAGKVDDAA